MKINQKQFSQTSTVSGGKKKVESGQQEVKDGFSGSVPVKEEVVVPKNLVLKAAGNEDVDLKPGEVLHKPTTMEIAQETAGKIAGPIGVATGLVGAGAGLYIGGLGGLVTGGAMGLGLGPAKAILTGKTGFDIVKTVFSTGGGLAKAGIVLGSATAAVGMGVLGYKLGKTAGLVPGLAIGLPVGIAADKSPVIMEAPKPKRKFKMGKVGSGLAITTAGVAGLTGLSGGALAGAGIASTGALVSGLMLKDLSLATITQTGLIGAAVGGGVLAIAAGVGGYKIIEWGAKALGKGTEIVVDGAGFVKDAMDNNKPGEEVKN